MTRAALLLLGLCLLEALALSPPAEAQYAGRPGDLLAAREIPRGATIERADIVADSTGTQAGEEILGWVAKRLINEGEALRAPAITPAEMVKAGETVQLVWRQGNLELRMSGRAMSSAGAGEKVLVRVDTKRRFEGVAEAPGVVRLGSTETSR